MKSVLPTDVKFRIKHTDRGIRGLSIEVDNADRCRLLSSDNIASDNCREKVQDNDSGGFVKKYFNTRPQRPVKNSRLIKKHLARRVGIFRNSVALIVQIRKICV